MLYRLTAGASKLLNSYDGTGRTGKAAHEELVGLGEAEGDGRLGLLAEAHL